MKILLVSLLVILLRIRTTVSQNVYDCGFPEVPVNEMIVQGHDTGDRGAWPWHVAIYRRHPGWNEYICGGTLVTKKHVITAAHCVVRKFRNNEEKLPVDRFFVELGVYRLNSTNEDIQRREIGQIHRTSNFARRDLRNDIAILELATKAEFGRFVKPACVSQSQDLIGRYGTVIGWGIDENNKTSTVLKSAWMPVVDVNTCLASSRPVFGKTLDEGIFCAGYTNGTTVCNGDSGGGIFFKENNAWHLGGIVSFSQFRKNDKLCLINGYGAFTKIRRYLAWIKSVTMLRLITDNKGQCEVRKFDESVNYANVLPQDCGTNNISVSTRDRDAGSVMEFPWMAVLHYENRSGRAPICAGSLIHKRYVLTTYACTSPVKPSYVSLGESSGLSRDCNDTESADCVPPVRDYEIQCIIRYPISWYSNDPNSIALVRLDQDVTFEVHIQPVCLPVAPVLRNLVLTDYTVIGWDGFDDPLKSPARLGEASVTTDVDCQFISPKVDNLICMTHLNGMHVCYMSEGSPLGNYAYYNGRRFVLFGLSPIQNECYFTAYVSTKNYTDWIVANIYH